MSIPLTTRDLVAEKAFLDSIRHLDWLLLQRDWQNAKHGDLDILLSARHWSQFIDRVVEFCSENDYPLAKAYEIEDAVVCAIVMTPRGRVHLDVALSRPRTRFFGIDTQNTLRRRDLSGSFPIAHKDDAVIYMNNKLKYKRSTARNFLKRISNISVILRRVANGVLFVNGGFIYIPFISDRDILRCHAVVTHNRAYLQGALRERYLFQQDDI